MPRFPASLAVVAALTAASSASAIDFGFGLFKRRQPAPNQPGKADPATRLKQLLATLQSDTDVDRRKAAAEELKSVDPRGHAEIFPVLVGTLQKDPNPGVRSAAAEALGSLRIGSAVAGAALEEVEKSDPDEGVRATAKAALWQYQLNGYKLSSAGPRTGQTAEPPFAKPTPSVSARIPTEVTFRPITQGPGKGEARETAEPPFARSKAPVSAPAQTPRVSAPIVPKDPPTILLPAPLPVPPPAPTKPGGLPPLAIPVVTPETVAPTIPPPAIPVPVIVAPPPGTGLPTIVPPGSGK